MIIKNIYPLSLEVVRLTLKEGVLISNTLLKSKRSLIRKSLTIRVEELPASLPGRLKKGALIEGEEENAIIKESVLYYAISITCKSLAKQERSAWQVKQGLLKKGFAPFIADNAVLSLEEKKIIDNARYARTYLSTRAISFSEGKTKLYSSLLAKGVSPEIAKKAIEDYFNTRSEGEALEHAIEKYARMHKKIIEELGKEGKTREEKEDKIKIKNKVISSLIRQGFSYKNIVKSIKEKWQV